MRYPRELRERHRFKEYAKYNWGWNWMRMYKALCRNHNNRKMWMQS